MLKYGPLVLAAWLCATLVPASALAEAPAKACPSRDPAPVVETLRGMYGALSIDDLAAFQRIVAADFYAYDVGKRFDGAALAEFVRTAHAAGTRFVWTVEEPVTTVACDLAWITYVNRGSVTRDGVAQPVTWLESAILSHDGTRWRIRFFHSTRAAAQS